MLGITDMKQEIREILDNTALTHEQAMMNLSAVPLNYVEFFETTKEFRELEAAGCLCTMNEGNVTYAPRYILPDYEKLLREGCSFLRLGPARTLEDAIMNLEIMYRFVPSVTHYPVYLGSVDKMLEPFIEDEEDAYRQIRRFLIFLDRTIPDSYCHMNLGPEATKAGRMIVEIQTELQNAIPSITLLYDPAITPDDFAAACAECALRCAKPSFANDREYKKIYPVPYGIASCYNALPVAGGAFTLSRIVLARLAPKAKDSEHFINELLPHAVKELCGYIEQKITFLVEETHFFKSNFLVTEGFLKLDNFVGMVGMVGLNECVNILMEKDGVPGTYGHSDAADLLGRKIMDRLKAEAESFTSKFCAVNGNHFVLHAQVGIADDYDISPGTRIAIGSEIPIHEHLTHCGKFHPYFNSGVGDIFPFDETADRNPDAIVDLIKGGFAQGMRYFSTYSSDADVIRITGYLVKKSDIVKLDNGIAVNQANAMWGLGEVKNSHILDRKVRSFAG